MRGEGSGCACGGVSDEAEVRVEVGTRGYRGCEMVSGALYTHSRLPVCLPATVPAGRAFSKEEEGRGRGRVGDKEEKEKRDG